MFGHLKTIKVWVVREDSCGSWYQRSQEDPDNLSEFEGFAVFSEMREIPWNKMAQMNTTIVLGCKIMSDCAGIEIIHVLVDRYIGRHKGIKEQKIQICEKIKTF
jgi:hypothetical protein